jgi:exosortase
VLAGLALLGLLTVALTVVLWPHWRENAELSHAFLMPVVFVFLLQEARRGPARFLPGGAGAAIAAGALLLLALAALAVSGLYATAVGWSHALVAFCLTGALALAWAGALVMLAGPASRLIPCNWAALVAIGLWLLSAPIPPGTYSRLTIALQFAVTGNVLRALHLLGIAAARHGNVIELATTSVGVEEACSGVRSLVSCVFVGLLLSATLVRRSRSRLVLVVLAGPVALAMNFIRSLALTLLANAGVGITGRWHDLTGYGILGATAAMLAGLALVLARLDGRATVRPAVLPAPPVPPGREPTVWVVGAALAIGIAGVAFFALSTRPSPRRNAPVPDLAALLPTSAPGWQVETSRELYQFSSTLHTDDLLQRTYLRSGDDGLLQVTVYVAYWRAGQAAASLVASHTPDACWPGNGWSPVPLADSRVSLSVGGRVLPEAEVRFFRNDQFPQYVWFWQLYDGRPIAFRDPYSARALLRSAWRYGFRRSGDQLFVRISSNQPWAAFQSDPLFAGIFARLRQQGL